MMSQPQVCQVQEQQCIIVLCFLKQSQYKELGLEQQQFRKNLIIFPSIVTIPFRIFINDGEVFRDSQEFKDYVQCVNLEGNLKRIVIFIDDSFQQQFTKNYCKIFLSDIYNDILEIVICNDRINVCQHNYLLLQQYWKNISIYQDKLQCFMKIFQNSQLLSSTYNKLNKKCMPIDEEISNQTAKIIDMWFTMNIFDMRDVNKIDQLYQKFAESRNQILQRCVSIPQNNRNQSILQCKFNQQFMVLISQFTNQVFDKISYLIHKFQNLIYTCQICKFYVYLNQRNYVDSIFFNSCFKKKSCQTCIYAQASFNNLTILYNQQRDCFQIEHCLKYLNQNQAMQFKNSHLKEKNALIHHVILIGQTGVGKTTLFNMLCNGQIYRDNEQTQEPIVKKCLNSNLSIMDTPPFELSGRMSFENREKAKLKFSNILTQQLVSQIFIVVKYERFSIMRKSMIDCLKFLYPFKDKISILILNDQDFQVKDSQTNLEKVFESNKILICELKFTPQLLNEEIEKLLYNQGARLEYLNLDNTEFDIKKYKTEQKAMIEKLENISSLRNQGNIQKQNQERILSNRQD